MAFTSPGRNCLTKSTSCWPLCVVICRKRKSRNASTICSPTSPGISWIKKPFWQKRKTMNFLSYRQFLQKDIRLSARLAQNRLRPNKMYHYLAKDIVDDHIRAVDTLFFSPIGSKKRTGRITRPEIRSVPPCESILPSGRIRRPFFILSVPFRQRFPP